MSERKSLSGGDWLAIFVFLAGTLPAVLMAYGLATGAGGSSGTAALGAAIAGAIGPWPALIGGAGIAFLGARAFLTGDRSGMITSILGVVGVAIGLSVVAGSLSEVRGGSLGAATGGRVAQMTHPAVGVLLGAIVAFGAAYFAWMREDPTAAAKLAPARRATPAPPRNDDDGVTAAESAMLIAERRVEDEVAPARPIAPPKPVKPLYPEDVRLKGEVPAGTKPLSGSTNALAASPALPASPEPAVYRWTAPRAASIAADPTRIAPEEIEALADDAPVADPVADVEEVVEVVEVSQVVVETTEAVEAAEAAVPPMPPRPTWESTGLDADDEPVDAYGTPLSLVEKARRDRDEVEEPAPVVAARIPREIGEIAEEPDAEPDLEVAREIESEALALEPETEDELDEELDEPALAAAPVETEVEAGDEPVAVAAEVDEVPELLAQQTSLLEELRASNAALRAEALVEDEYDVLEAEVSAVAEVEPASAMPALDEDDLLEEELAAEESVIETTRVELVAVDVPAEEEIEEEEAVTALVVEETEEESEDEDEVDAGDVLSEAAVSDEEEVEEEEELDEEPALAAVSEPVAPAPAPAPARAKSPAVPSLFDTVETEREHVLTPQAAVPASRAEKAPGRGIDPEKKLLVEVGCMFVERGRVAVSMLQRQYDMDFDQACRVLDDLQEMGLIGPYMGGKNRDILLTKEKWLEKVGVG